MTKREKGILVFSDIHCGSIFGMLPPGFENSAETIVNSNAGQEYLWTCWLDLRERIRGLDLVAAVANGDMIDGCQRAQRGTELAIPLIADQAKAAVETIQALKLQIPLYFVQGTEYHDAKGGRELEAVAKFLNAVPYRGLGTGLHSKEVLNLEEDGVVINFAHAIGGGSGLYRATASDREGIWSALAGKENKMPKADCLVRSHVHYFNHLEYPSKHIVITPCWELQTRFMRRNSVYRMIPDIGAVIIWVDGQAKKQGEDPIRVQKILYDLPKIATTKLQSLKD